MPENFYNVALQWGLVYGGAVVVAAWVTMVIWAYRDMRARSRDTWAQLLVAGVVLLLNLPGLLIYIFLRPRETMAEAYERSLEEEALLQEIEDKPNCPGCGMRAETDWQACPHCHTRLKKPCINCGEMLQLAWDLCPYCATLQTTGAKNKHAHVSRRVNNPEPPPPQDEDRLYDADLQQAQDNGSSYSEGLEFIDGDY